MSDRPRFYYPSLLRFLHGCNALAVILAWLAAIFVYNRYDARLLKLPLPDLPASIDIHGTFGVGLLLTLPLFALYSFHLGSQRLVRSHSFRQLRHLDRPAGWYALHRIANTLMLLAVTLAFATGRMMKEAWLPEGNLQEIWYTLHLWSWVAVGVSLALHVSLGLRVGGTAMLRSIWSRTTRPHDTPRQWTQQVQKIWKP